MKQLDSLSPTVGFWFIGIFLLLLAPFLFHIRAKAELSCYRTDLLQGSCRLVQASWLATETREIALAKLQGAVLEAPAAASSNRVLLLTPTESLPLSPLTINGFGTSSYRGKQQSVTQINRFLRQTGDRTLTIQQDDRWIFLAGGLGSIMLGMVHVFLAVREACASARLARVIFHQ